MEFNRKTIVYSALAAMAFVGLAGGASYMGVKLASTNEAIVANNETEVSYNTAVVRDSNSSQPVVSTSGELNIPPLPTTSYDRMSKKDQDDLAERLIPDGYSSNQVKIVIAYYADNPSVPQTDEIMGDIIDKYYTNLEKNLPDYHTLTKDQQMQALEANGVVEDEAKEYLEVDRHDEDVYRIGPGDVSQSNGRREAAAELKSGQ